MIFGNFTLENVKNIQKFEIQNFSNSQNVRFTSSKMNKIGFT